MGRDKAWLPWRGQPMIAHVVSILRPIVDEVVVVTSDELELPPLDARVVRDREPALGPLAGIREGLEQIRADLAFVTGTDAPFLSPAFVEKLLSCGCAAAAEIDGHVQTLAAVYPRNALDRIRELLAEGCARPLQVLEEFGYRKLSAEELPDPQSVRGFNTPDEYLEAVRAVDGQATAKLEFQGRARLAVGCREIEVPVGTLGDVLAPLQNSIAILDGDVVAKPFSIWLNGLGPASSAAIPVGPGERIRVGDAAVGC
ncbi:MAG: molybdenum cofactor guanylyltransferase [Deltaproteobacteria bacterium]|jgi:molybdopterin-guanine dinucleotide biosynthesis protein A|nr:molybdenum cofactor guanylyltransferase [Deltaproteobacteria bacterium]MBW2542045.1 molybdenum cofactor guanylyltransferase [Deltaproteobacteria bacterium]